MKAETRPMPVSRAKRESSRFDSYEAVRSFPGGRWAMSSHHDADRKTTEYWLKPSSIETGEAVAHQHDVVNFMKHDTGV